MAHSAPTAPSFLVFALGLMLMKASYNAEFQIVDRFSSSQSDRDALELLNQRPDDSESVMSDVTMETFSRDMLTWARMRLFH